MTTQHIDKTLVATSDPVTIADGIRVDKDLPVPNFGGSFGTTLWDKTVTTPILKIISHSTIELEAGILGPSWGGRMEFEGDITDEDLSFEVNMDEFIGGMIIGVQVRFDLIMDTEIPWGSYWEHTGPHFYSGHWVTNWKDAFDKTVEFRFDLLATLWDIALLIGKMIPALQKILAFVPIGLFDHMVDAKSGIMSSSHGGKGTIEVFPQLSGKIDLINLLEVLIKSGAEVVQPELTLLIVAYNIIMNLVKSLKPSLTTGPILGVAFPIRVSITQLTVDYANDVSTYVSDLTFKDNTVSGPLKVVGATSAVTNVGAQFTHSTGMDFVVGWSVDFHWLKVIDIPVSWKKPVLSALGFDVTSLNPHEIYSVGNDVGAMTDANIKITFIEEVE